MGTAGERYDEIGLSYAKTRQEDPRVAEIVHSCLGSGERVVNVGAGSGNYEPRDRAVTAVEPSVRMIAQRPRSAARVVRAVAEHLPFRDGTFDVAMALLTVHHWSDQAAGLREMARVAPRQVIFYFEPIDTHDFWGVEYFPTTVDLPTEIDPPGPRLFSEHLNVREIKPVLIPRDCRDGFAAAFWARPECYLDPEVQGGMSWLALLEPEERRRGTERLRADLASGEWDRRFGHLRHETTFDGVLRIAIAHSPG